MIYNLIKSLHSFGQVKLFTEQSLYLHKECALLSNFGVEIMNIYLYVAVIDSGQTEVDSKLNG